MVMRQITILSSLLLCIVGGTQLANAKCPSHVKQGAFIYAVGSSTLGSPLGEQLSKRFKKKGYRFRKWAKASSGLARPDFHDWLKSMREIDKQWSPDVYIVSLGTNDYQALYHRKKWIKTSEKRRWIEEYAKRVDRMLELAAGKNKQRMVIWIGPVPFDTSKGRNMSLRITRILRERIQAFDGNAVFVDVRSSLMSNNRPIQYFIDSKKKKRKTYRKDKVHLTIAAVQHLMARRVEKAVENCAQ